ncbi:MAG: RNA 3'-terminal phosphate cyclase [bacterium]|nr:RNA 3'-terminal phosphate cyclase [bacterium]
MSIVIEVDGSYLGGQDQVIRTSCILSAITKNPCRVFNIHNNDEKKGLSAQLLLEIEAIAKLSNANLEGNFLGSQEIRFYPGGISESQNLSTKSGLTVKLAVSESIILILQDLIPLSLFFSEPIKVSFEGGATDTFFSPTTDYFRYVFLKILEKMGGKIDINIIERGYYPEGGAQVEAKIYPSTLKKLELTERGSLEKIIAISGASELLRDKKVAERQLAGMREILGKLKLPVEERIEYHLTQCPGSHICLIGEFENTIIGTDNLGKLGKRPEDIGKEAALDLLNEQKTNTCLDKRSIGQILVYLALAKGKSHIKIAEITNQQKAIIWVIEKFIKGNFEIKKNAITWRPIL